ncbi:organic solvent tolerance protein OstA [Nostoc minutum NIES-26]|uniref:Organic solvent tolerance protein OstA n=1 Tax=Nostoc minutum NIES-26 TaxID=1844469 RepID=A0A367QNN0_9NOSO|nr:organic solvent tolerance protein OstA [Nostoc minutum NIES-26]
MLHSVPPPTLPPILEPVQPVNSITSASTIQFPAIAEATSPSIQVNKEKSELKRETPPIPNTGIAENSPLLSSNDVTKYNLVAAKIAAPNKPETFPPEFSPLAASRSAVNLGQPQAVGYPMQQVKVANPGKTSSSDRSVVPRVTNNKNFLPPKAQVLAEELTQQVQPVDTSTQQSSGESNLSVSAFEGAPNAPSSQPVQNIIEFKSRSQTNEASTPSTIEFQSPSPAQQTQPPPAGTPQQPAPTTTPPARERVVEVISDRQEYDEQRRIVTAEGNVVVRFDGAVVDADRLQVNLDNLIAVGEGNVALTRGDQVLRGQRFTYNFVQDSGELENGKGEIYIPSASTDFAFNSTDVTTSGVPQRPPSDRIRANQPTSGVSSPGGIDFALGGGRDASNVPAPKTGGVVRRVRFEAKHIDFYPRGWQARDVRLTNDPFSPPELELRADKVTVTREAPLVDRIKTQRQRLVFDQKFSLPIPLDQRTIDRREREVTPTIVSPGFDGDKRGGLYVERSFTPLNTEQANFTITPQFFVQKAVQGGISDVASVFGVKSKLNAVFSPRTTLQGSGELTSFDLDEVDENLRASLRLRQLLGEPNPHILNLEYSYRDRLYNGTLGFQTVQSSLGGVLLSPVIPLGKSGVNLTYQAGAQYINANTDRQDLLEPNRENDRISLGRLQASADLSKGFLLWQGKPLPPTATQGLKYTANPVVPYLQAIVGITGTSSYYSNGDNQSTLTGRVGLVGQIGNFSRPFLDYTAFNITYFQGLNSGLSPFLFDRSVDNRVLSAGISQQIYGPFRLGFQTSINLDTGEESSTDYFVEYSRRTYGITLRYNPVLELGGFSIRISDFNWTGGTNPFSDGQVKPVVNGVQQQN